MMALTVAILVLGGGYVFVKNSQSPAVNQQVSEVQDEIGEVGDEARQVDEENGINEATDEGAMEEKDEDAKMETGVKTFELSASSFKYDIKEIRVKQGDKVNIVLNNKDGMHDWVIDEFNAKTKQITAGQTDTVEFVADKKGSFEYYCSVGQHRANGMFGKLIVE